MSWLTCSFSIILSRIFPDLLFYVHNSFKNIVYASTYLITSRYRRLIRLDLNISIISCIPISFSWTLGEDFSKALRNGGLFSILSSDLSCWTIGLKYVVGFSVLSGLGYSVCSSLLWYSWPLLSTSIAFAPWWSVSSKTNDYPLPLGFSMAWFGRESSYLQFIACANCPNWDFNFWSD